MRTVKRDLGKLFGNSTTVPIEVKLKIPAYVKFLNYFGLKGWNVYQDNEHYLSYYESDIYDVKDHGTQDGMRVSRMYQNGSSGRYIRQRYIEVDEFYQNRIKFQILDETGIIFKELFQKNTEIETLKQSKMKGKYADQSGSLFENAVQDWIEVETLDHRGVRSSSTVHIGAKIGTLITDSETDYGDWDLENATIDSWEGDGINFDKIDITGAKLPRELYDAISYLKSSK